MKKFSYYLLLLVAKFCQQSVCGPVSSRELPKALTLKPKCINWQTSWKKCWFSNVIHGSGPTLYKWNQYRLYLWFDPVGILAVLRLRRHGTGVVTWCQPVASGAADSVRHGFTDVWVLSWPAMLPRPRTCCSHRRHTRIDAAVSCRLDVRICLGHRYGRSRCLFWHIMIII